MSADGILTGSKTAPGLSLVVPLLNEEEAVPVFLAAIRALGPP